MQFSDKLKKLRKDNGISQSELAAVLYVSRSAVAKWENGLGVPCDQSLDRIAEYFSVSRDYFNADGFSANQVAMELSTKTRNNTIPMSARVCSMIVTFLLFIYATVISAFWVTQDDFEIGISVLTEASVIAFIVFGMVVNILEFISGKDCRARFLSYGVGVGVGVLFACMFATHYYGLIKYGSICVGAPIALITANEAILFTVGRDCKADKHSMIDNKSNGKLYACFAVATVMFGLNIYPIIMHAVDFHYDLGMLFFVCGLYMSIISVLLVVITKRWDVQSALAYSLGALMFGGMLFLVPGLLDIAGNGAYYYGIYVFYEYLTYELLAWCSCCLLLIFTLAHYFSYYKHVISTRMKCAAKNN